MEVPAGLDGWLGWVAGLGGCCGAPLVWLEDTRLSSCIIGEFRACTNKRCLGLDQQLVRAKFLLIQFSRLKLNSILSSNNDFANLHL